MKSVRQPVDAYNNPINRAMAIPQCSYNQKIGSNSYWATLIALQEGRVYRGIAIENSASTETLYISFSTDDEADDSVDIAVPALSSYFFDEQLFGAVQDPYLQLEKISKIRAKLSAQNGTQSSSSFTYGGTNVSNGDTFVFNGVTYEFSNDQSAEPGRVKVDIGASADASWTNLVSVINGYQDEAEFAVNTGTNTITITAHLGGSSGNGLAWSSAIAGLSAASGATASGSGGITPIVHVW